MDTEKIEGKIAGGLTWAGVGQKTAKDIAHAGVSTVSVGAAIYSNPMFKYIKSTAQMTLDHSEKMGYTGAYAAKVMQEMKTVAQVAAESGRFSLAVAKQIASKAALPLAAGIGAYQVSQNINNAIRDFKNGDIAGAVNEAQQAVLRTGAVITAGGAVATAPTLLGAAALGTASTAMALGAEALAANKHHTKPTNAFVDAKSKEQPTPQVATVPQVKPH